MKGTLNPSVSWLFSDITALKQIVLPVRPGPALGMPTHSACIIAYRRQHQIGWPCLGLLGFPDGTPMRIAPSRNQESEAPLFKPQQLHQRHRFDYSIRAHV